MKARARWVAAGLVLAACTGEPSVRVERDRPRDAAPAALDAGTADSQAGFVGVLIAGEAVDIAPRIAGRVAQVHVRVGERVAAGALIAEMDSALLAEEVRAAEAALRAVEAASREADVGVAEATWLVDGERAAVAAGTSPRNNLEAAELALQKAKAVADRARSTLAEQRTRLAAAQSRHVETAIRTPFAGTVAIRYRDAGANVSAGAPIVRVVGDGEVRLRFAVPPERVDRLAVGTEVDVQIETQPTPRTAIVRYLSPVVDSASRMVIVEGELTAVASGLAPLRPGLAVTVRLR